MDDVWDLLRGQRADREQAGLVRRPRARTPNDPVLDLASNDHLGLSRHPDVVAAGRTALAQWGAGSTGSRLVTGTTALHLELEAELARRCGAPAALVLSSGYLANLAAVTALATALDTTLVISDERNHASLVDACRLARVPVAVVPHADPGAVEELLEGHDGRALVVTDAVFSVDGTLAPLRELHAVVRRHRALLLVDEAHGLGVLGPDGAGACAELGLSEEPDLVRTVTLSKSLGSQGGAVLGPAVLRDHLIDTARPFVFDTGLAPACAAAALAALNLVDAPRLARLREVGEALADGLGVARTPGAAVQVPVGDSHRAVAVQQACLSAGVWVGCFRPPSVPSGHACLRLTARADLSADELQTAVRVVRQALGGPA